MRDRPLRTPSDLLLYLIMRGRPAVLRAMIQPHVLEKRLLGRDWRGAVFSFGSGIGAQPGSKLMRGVYAHR